MFCMVILTPMLMIYIGKRHIDRPPKVGKKFYGYYSKMSIKSDDTWNYAQKIFGQTWYQLGKSIIIPSVLPMFFVIGKSDYVVGVTASVVIFLQQMVFMLFITFYKVEKSLRETFNKDGSFKT